MDLIVTIIQTSRREYHLYKSLIELGLGFSLSCYFDKPQERVVQLTLYLIS